MSTFAHTDQRSAALADLVASLDQPERHDFDQTPTVAGEVVEVRHEQNRRGDVVPLVVVRTSAGGEVVVECTPTSLRRQVEDNPPTPGALIAFRYNGMATGKSGREYRSFTVRQAPGVAPESAHPEPDEPPIPDPLDQEVTRPDDADDIPF